MVETGNHTGTAVGDVTVVRDVGGTINRKFRDANFGIGQVLGASGDLPYGNNRSH
jgi:hypothetical protein